MSDVIKKISNFSKFNELVSESVKLFEKLDLYQISIQIMKDREYWNESAGWLTSEADEFKFNTIHPELKDSIFEEYINSFPYPIYRSRIMVMRPNDRYSIHRDPTPRIHIPLVTNEKSFFLFPTESLKINLPADGTIYWSDTRKLHTFINSSNQNRIHIISTTL